MHLMGWQKKQLKRSTVMSYIKWGYTVEGAWPTIEPIEDRSGVYVIYCQIADVWKVIDVGESVNLQTRLATHDRKKCWEKYCNGNIYFAVIYTPNMQQAGRMEIEQRIRSIEKPVCGDR